MELSPWRKTIRRGARWLLLWAVLHLLTNLTGLLFGLLASNIWKLVATPMSILLLMSLGFGVFGVLQPPQIHRASHLIRIENVLAMLAIMYLMASNISVYFEFGLSLMSNGPLHMLLLTSVEVIVFIKVRGISRRLCLPKAATLATWVIVLQVLQPIIDFLFLTYSTPIFSHNWEFPILFTMLVVSFSSVVLTIATLAFFIRGLTHDQRNFCESCGYDLTGLTSNICPECGHPFRFAPPDPASPQPL